MYLIDTRLACCYDKIEMSPPCFVILMKHTNDITTCLISSLFVALHFQRETLSLNDVIVKDKAT